MTIGYKPITIALNRILNNITGSVVNAETKEKCRDEFTKDHVGRDTLKTI